MASSKSGSKRGRGRKPAGKQDATTAQKDGIKSSLSGLIEEKQKQRFYARYLNQVDIERIVGVGDWDTWERQFGRNYEVEPKQGESPWPRPKLTRLSKLKKTDNPF